MGWESRVVGAGGCSAGLLSSHLLSRSHHAAPSLREGCGGGGRDKADSLSTSQLHLPILNHPQLTLPLDPFLKLQDASIASRRMCCSRQPCQRQDGR